MATPSDKLDELLVMVRDLPDELVQRLRDEESERQNGADAPGDLPPIDTEPPDANLEKSLSHPQYLDFLEEIIFLI